MRFGGRRSFGGRSFGQRRNYESYDMPKPIKVGEEYDVEIKEMGSKGDGIARVNNFVVFVNGTKLGEKTRVKITDVRDRFAIGEKIGSESTTKETDKVVKENEEESEEGESESPEEESKG